jgi:hypothetical protein
MVSQNMNESAVRSLDDMKALFRELETSCNYLPPGEYYARLERMTYVPGRKPSFLLQFNVVSPRTDTGKKAYRRLWVTENAIRTTLHDLAKIGIRDIAETQDVQTSDLLCTISVNDSTSESRVIHFDVVS